MKNWFTAKNGPSGEYLIDLMRYSDEVLETVLFMARRVDLLNTKKLGDMHQRLKNFLAEMDEVQRATEEIDQ